MECIQITINMKKKDDVYVIRPIGDIHLGNENCDVDKLKSVVKEISKIKGYKYILIEYIPTKKNIMI